MPISVTGPTGTPITAPVQQATNYAWAQQMLVDGGFPTTANNIRKVVRWMWAEQNRNWTTIVNGVNHNNPLNINVTGNGAGTDVFPSLSESANAVGSVWLDTYSNYTALKNNLMADGSIGDFSAALVASPWAKGHYGGDPQILLQIPDPPVLTIAGQNLGSVTGAQGASVSGSSSSSSTKTPGQCSSGGGVFGIGTGCQIKGLVGGLLIGAGIGTAVVGLVILASRSQTVQAAAKTAAGLVAPETRAATLFGSGGGQLTGAVRQRRQKSAGAKEADELDRMAAESMSRQGRNRREQEAMDRETFRREGFVVEREPARKPGPAVPRKNTSKRAA